MESRFAHGVGWGIALAAVLIQGWLAVELSGMRDMYRDFGGGLPALTELVISPAWRWGVPLVGIAVLAALIVRRPRALVAYSVAAALLCGTVTMTWYAAQWPLRQLAGNIKAE